MSSGKNGFILLEAVVALAITGLFTVSLLALVGTQVRAADRAGSLLVARALAQDRMAALKLLDYDHVLSVPDSIAGGRFGPPFEVFGWTSRVEAVNDEHDLFEARVTVTGRGYEFPLRTLIHRPRPVLEVTE